MADPTLIGTIVVTGGALITAVFTRRSAKDTTAVGGFTQLTNSLHGEVTRLTARVDQLESREVVRRSAMRTHTRWDLEMAQRVRNLSPDPVPDPPPLDIWE